MNSTEKVNIAGDHGVGVEMVENGKPEATVIPEFSQDEINMEKRYLSTISEYSRWLTLHFGQDRTQDR